MYMINLLNSLNLLVEEIFQRANNSTTDPLEYILSFPSFFEAIHSSWLRSVVPHCYII